VKINDIELWINRDYLKSMIYLKKASYKGIHETIILSLKSEGAPGWLSRLSF